MEGSRGADPAEVGHRDPSRGSGPLRCAGIAHGLLAAAALGGSLWLMPPESDGAAAVSDGLWYGWQALHEFPERMSGHHPLFHALAAGAARALAAVGIEDAGHVAARLLAGLGAGTIVLLIGMLGSWCWPSFCLALAFLATRGVMMEAAAGENVLPACAAALGCLVLAAGRRPALVPLTCLLVVALGLRQDNLLIVPGVLLAALPGLPRGRRLRPLLGVLVTSGLVTLAGYVVAWRFAQPGWSFADYLLELPRSGLWTDPDGLRWSNAHIQGASFAVAVAGVQWEVWERHLALAGAWIGAVLLAGVLGRGRAPAGRLALGAAAIVALRFPLFLWFEPQNYEWQILPLVLVAALVARLVGGSARWPAGRLVAGSLLLALAVATLVLHGPATWSLRTSGLRESARLAREWGGVACRYVALGHRAATAFHLEAIPAEQLGGALPEAQETLARMLVERPVRTVVLLDRFAHDGMPLSRDPERDPLAGLDRGSPVEGATLLRHEGRVVALGWP